MICNGVNANNTVAPMILGMANNANVPNVMAAVFSAMACGDGEPQAQRMNGNVVT